MKRKVSSTPNKEITPIAVQMAVASVLHFKDKYPQKISTKQHFDKCGELFASGGRRAVLTYCIPFNFTWIFCRQCSADNPSLEGQCLVCGATCFVADQPAPGAAVVRPANIEEGNIEIPKTYGTHLVVVNDDTLAIVGILSNVGKVPMAALKTALCEHFDAEVYAITPITSDTDANMHFAAVLQDEDETETHRESFTIHPTFYYA